MTDLLELIQRIPAWVYLAFIVHGAVLATVAYLILLERKVASWAQDRIGPNRTGLGFGIIPWLKDKKMFGLGQPLADGLKFILKEDYRPRGVDVILFTVAPAIMIAVVIVSIVVIPWGGWKQSTTNVTVRQADVAPATFEPAAIRAAAVAKLPPGSTIMPGADVAPVSIYAAGGGSGSALEAQVPLTYRYRFQIADLNIGVLFILAILSLAVYGVVIGGWASNNKYSFLGGLRATANMISYEIPLGLSVLAIVILFGTLDMGVIVDRQAGYWLGVIPAWNVFTQPLAFLMFLICIHAEANRAPFDLAEAEQELVGGYHTEYSSMRFALFFLAEYAGMITTSAVCVALFFGGWHFPGVDRAVIAVTNFFGADNAPIDPANPSVTTSLALCIVRACVLFGKTVGIVFVFMWVRWSLPRFRFDQLMMIAWRGLIPISLAQLLLTAVVVYLHPVATTGIVNGSTAVALLISNAVLIAGAMIVSLLLPAPPPTNRRLDVAESRFRRTAVPGSAVRSAARA
jgi:NADH-quinone oxidoreductase subunit H